MLNTIIMKGHNMRITPAYNIFSNFNYQNTPAKQNAITAFKGTDTNDEFIPETHIRSEQEEAEKRKYNLFKAKIDNVQVEGNNVTIETLDGKTKKVEIPEVCFENIKDRQKAVEKWLIDIADEELCGSLELCVAAQELGLCEENETINEYKQALEKGIKVLNYSYNNRYTGKNILDLEIDDIPHRFLTYQSLYRCLRELNKSENCTGSMIDAPRFYSDEYDIQNMVKNIRAAGRGSVITVGNKDIVLPQILDRVPDVKKDEIRIQYARPCLVESYDYDKRIFEKLLPKNHNPEEIKLIYYIEKPYEGYDNNILHSAYGYYDSEQAKTYLYIPSEKRIQLLYSNGQTKNIDIPKIKDDIY